MNYLLTTIVATTLSFSSWAINAEPVDGAPPAKSQKEKLPDSNSTGDYLESQPNNAGETESHKDKSKASKPSNMKKSKSLTEEPEDGGVDLK